MTFLPLSLRRHWLALGTLGLQALTPAYADTLVYSETTTETAPGFSIGFNLPAFDSNLGTLDKVTFSYDISASGSMQVSSDGSDPFAGYGGQIQSVNFLSTPSNVGPGLSPEVVLVAIGVGNALPSGSETASGTTEPTGIVPTDISTYGLWEALGGGTLSFLFKADGSSFQGGGSSAISFGTPTMSEIGTFTVTYDFTPVPESSAAVAVSGAAALAVLAKLRQRKQPAQQAAP